MNVSGAPCPATIAKPPASPDSPDSKTATFSRPPKQPASTFSRPPVKASRFSRIWPPAKSQLSFSAPGPTA